MTSSNSPTDAHVRAMPKVELHVHVEGAVAPATIAELAVKNGVDLGVDDPAALYQYTGLEDFLRVFDIVCRSLRDADDLQRVTYEALGIAAAAGVRYREMFFSPTFLMRLRRCVRHHLARHRGGHPRRPHRPRHRGADDHGRAQAGGSVGGR